MTKLLLLLFVKNHQNPQSPEVRGAIGKLSGFVGILCNILLFICKFVVGWIAGSAAVIADAVNNLLDASSSIILLSGGDQARTAIEKIINPTAAHFTTATFIILSLSIAIKLWMCVFYNKLAKKIQSTTLLAASVDSRNDVLASASVLLCCILEYRFGIKLDAYAALAVAVFILYSGIKLTGETISPLLGKKADDELIEQISDLILSHEPVLGIHDLLIHDYGPGKCYASVHAEMSASEDPVVTHEIIDHIEREILEQINVNLVIHFDPVMKDD